MKEMTVILQIGNTDDKLPQGRWHCYVSDTDVTVDEYATQRHFFGAPENWSRWQNVAWVFSMDEERYDDFIEELREIRGIYEQESVAVTLGNTIFV